MQQGPRPVPADPAGPGRPGGGGRLLSVARVRVPATSANLGPGFDTLGLALSLHDEVVVRVGGGDTARAGEPGGLRVRVTGEGADDVPRDASNLVVRSLYAGLAELGFPPESLPGHEVACTTRIPHARGLGSSAAAIVAGLVAARALVPDGRRWWPDARLLVRASELEGHPDNVAACLFGGFTIAWVEGGRARAVGKVPVADLSAVVLVPPVRASTVQARGLLPETVPHGDAARNAARAALLVEALAHRPDLLRPATEDMLHQRYREPAMPESVHLVGALRDRGLAAVLSGAGPSVLVLGSSADAEAAVSACPDDWQARRLAADRDGARVLPQRAG